MKNLFKKMLFFLPLTSGIVVFALIVHFKEKPKTLPPVEQPSYVKACRAQRLTVRPKIYGFGSVSSTKTWVANPQVAGKIVWISDYLKAGEFFKAGQKMLKIDDSLYKLKIIQQQAEIKKIEANLLELDAKEKNYKVTLQLQKKNLAISLKEEKRQRELSAKKVVATADLERQQITTLTHKNNVQNIISSLELIPSQRRFQQAQLEAAKALLSQLELDLSYTVIAAPFDCRVSNENVEISQFIQPGSKIIEADSIATAEIAAQVDFDKLAMIITGDSKDHKFEFSDSLNPNIPEMMGMKAVVSYKIGNRKISWEARCSRLEAPDPNTRTVGVVAIVDQPYHKTASRPPLAKGLFCSVDIYGKERPDSLVIPRAALHDRTVYFIDHENRLRKRKVEIKYFTGNIAVISKGLKEGDAVVISDLTPAIEGGLLKPAIDKVLENKIVATATGDNGGK